MLGLNRFETLFNYLYQSYYRGSAILLTGMLSQIQNFDALTKPLWGDQETSNLLVSSESQIPVLL